VTPEERASYWYDATKDSCAELEQAKQLIDTWRLALLTIAGGDMQDGRWGRIALEALDKEQKP